jgi:hypothetical protein
MLDFPDLFEPAEKIYAVDFLETLRKDLCSGVIICYMFEGIF